MPVISIRVSDEWLSVVDAEAERCIWSRNAAIVNLVWQALLRPKVDESVSILAVPQYVEGTAGAYVAVEKEKRAGNQAGSVGAVVAGSGNVAAGSRGKAERKTGQSMPRTHEQGGSVSGSGTRAQICPGCGSLNGVHAKWCKEK